MGNSVFSRFEESIISFLRSKTKLPTIFSRNSLSREAWCSVRIIFRSSGKVRVSSGKQSETWATKSIRSRKETIPVDVAVVGEARKISRCD